ncbi:excisionase family protein [Shewanella sp. N2AIL]|uniref:excisionase family protein n=1 Tax=Shewanella sp. N2AIL TaxID=2926851 RepID=UPI001F5AAD5B|nr:excisionase family protein [Shewanella sp. N2AIL]MCI2964812.1 excisionase family protein [Shewanella sp. N2AIL]
MSQKLGWVTAEILERYKGLTYNAIKSKIRRKVLIKVIHYKKFDGTNMFHYEAIDVLINEQGN